MRASSGFRRYNIRETNDDPQHGDIKVGDVTATFANIRIILFYSYRLCKNCEYTHQVAG